MYQLWDQRRVDQLDMFEQFAPHNNIGGHVIARVFLCMLLSTCLITQTGCRNSTQLRVGGDGSERVFAALDRGLSLGELPEPFPFYQRKGDDVFWYESEQAVFDPDGVIMRDYGDKGITYHPVLIASHALRLYDTYKFSGEQDVGERFLQNAEWLARNLQPWHGGWAWLYELPNPAFGATEQWISGMAQGLCIAVLAQAEALTGDVQFLDAARRAMDVFEMELQEGGVRTLLPEGGWWYEEVAAPDVESSLILNGNIYALMGLGYYADLTGDSRARNLYEKGLDGVLELLPDFDGFYSSRYCLGPAHEFRPAGEFYNLVHVQQLIELWRRERNPVFARFSLRFLAYQADGVLKNEVVAHAAMRNGSGELLKIDIGDLVSGVKGFWDYSSDDMVTVSIQDSSELPLSGVAVREWQGRLLSDFDISLNTAEESQQLLVVHDGAGSEVDGQLTREKVRSRNAYMWFVGLDNPYVVESAELHIDNERIGLRQLVLVHSYPFVVAPVETRIVLQPSVMCLFDAREETFWAVPSDDIKLVLWRRSPTSRVELLWSEAATGLIQSVVFHLDELKERNVVQLVTGEGKTWSIELELIAEELIEFTVDDGLESEIRLHEFVEQEKIS